MTVDEFIERCRREVEPDLGIWSNGVSWQGTESWRGQMADNTVVVFDADEVYVGRSVIAKCHTLTINETADSSFYHETLVFDPPLWRIMARPGKWLLCGPQSAFGFSTDPVPLEAICAAIEAHDLEKLYQDS